MPIQWRALNQIVKEKENIDKKIFRPLADSLSALKAKWLIHNCADMSSALYHILSYIFHRAAIPRWDDWLSSPLDTWEPFGPLKCVCVIVCVSVLEKDICF